MYIYIYISVGTSGVLHHQMIKYSSIIGEHNTMRSHHLIRFGGLITHFAYAIMVIVVVVVRIVETSPGLTRASTNSTRRSRTWNDDTPSIVVVYLSLRPYELNSMLNICRFQRENTYTPHDEIHHSLPHHCSSCCGCFVP